MDHHGTTETRPVTARRTDRRAARTWVLVLLLALSACAVRVEQAPEEPAFEEGIGEVDPGEEQEVPLEILENPGGGVLAFAPVFIDDQGPLMFALDTGASHSVLDATLAEELGLEETGESLPITGVVAGGEARPAEVPQWRVGGVELPSGTIALLDLGGGPGAEPPLDGLLGSDVLSGFGAITVDYEQGRLLLSPQSRAP